MNPKEFSESPNRVLPDTHSEHQGVKMNGLEQVIQMLRHADHPFRVQMLKRIQAKDPELAQKLLKALSR